MKTHDIHLKSSSSHAFHLNNSHAQYVYSSKFSSPIANTPIEIRTFVFILFLDEFCLNSLGLAFENIFLEKYVSEAKNNIKQMVFSQIVIDVFDDSHNELLNIR